MFADKFGFLFPRNFVKLDAAEIKVATSGIVQAYGKEFDGDDLERETRSFQVEFSTN